MQFKQIECFLTIAKCKSFTEAASALYISQPAISRHIANMESEMNVELFKRDKCSVELTPAGEIMNKAFTKLAQEYDAALMKARQTQTTGTGSLHLGIAEYIPFYALPVSIHQFLKRNSAYAVYTEYAWHSTLTEGLQNGKYDLIVTLEKNVENLPELEYKILCSVNCSFICSKDYIRGKEDLGWKALDGADFFVPEPSLIPGGAEDVTRLCYQYGIKPNSITPVANTSTMVLMAETGQGVTILDHMATADLDSNLLTAIPVDLSHNIVLAIKKHSENPQIRELAVVLEQVLHTREKAVDTDITEPAAMLSK